MHFIRSFVRSFVRWPSNDRSSGSKDDNDSDDGDGDGDDDDCNDDDCNDNDDYLSDNNRDDDGDDDHHCDDDGNDDNNDDDGNGDNDCFNSGGGDNDNDDDDDDDDDSGNVHPSIEAAVRLFQFKKSYNVNAAVRVRLFASVRFRVRFGALPSAAVRLRGDLRELGDALVEQRHVEHHALVVGLREVDDVLHVEHARDAVPNEVRVHLIT